MWGRKEMRAKEMGNEHELFVQLLIDNYLPFSPVTHFNESPVL